MPVLLEVSGLSVSYATPNGYQRAVDDASFAIDPGEVVAIVGESGSGKTTMANAVVGLLPGAARIDAGRITLSGRGVLGLPAQRRPSELRRRIALVSQDPTVSLDPVKRVGAQVAEVLSIHGLADRAAARQRSVELLEQAGLVNAAASARQYPHELSGGMQQRVLIAIALASNPELLVADEPTSALDVTVQRQILDHLERLTNESGIAVLMITHDLAVAGDRADRVVVMSRGRIVEQGTAPELLTSPSHAYTRALIASDPSLNTYGRDTVEDGAPGSSTTPLVSIEEVVKEYSLPRGGTERVRRAVDGVTLSLTRGETFAVVGESGSGKTTLARMVLGLVAPTSGRIVVDGRDLAMIGRAEMRQLRRRMQVIYQNPYSSLDPRYTVEQIVSEPMRVHGTLGRAARRVRTRELLELVALPAQVIGRKRGELSGGQCQRAAIARALALEPDMLICDEPVSALDVTVQDQVLRLLTSLQRELGLTMLFISHDLAVVRQVADRVAVMQAGVVVEQRRAAELFRDPEHNYTKRLLEAVPGRRFTLDSSRIETPSAPG